MRFDFLETFLLGEKSDIEWPFKELKFDWVNRVTASNSDRLLVVVINYWKVEDSWPTSGEWVTNSQRWGIR
jgi:hypothetical protein